MTRAVTRSLPLTLVGLIAALLAVIWVPPAHAADKDCGDFNTQKAAQEFYINAGGPSRTRMAWTVPITMASRASPTRARARHGRAVATMTTAAAGETTSRRLCVRRPRSSASPTVTPSRCG